MALALKEWVGPKTPERVIAEIPVVYFRNKQKVDANDLVHLAGVSYAALALFGGCGTGVTPQQWKGTLAKEIFAKRILSRLSAYEMSVLDDLKMAESKKHNVIDAIGLGLWGLGRLQAKRW
jgi:hypothetical protein